MAIHIPFFYTFAAQIWELFVLKLGIPYGLSGTF